MGRSDVARVRWGWFDFRRNIVTVKQKKGDKELALPITPMLREIVEPLKRESEFVLVRPMESPFRKGPPPAA